jgi:hypothetical protein
VSTLECDACDALLIDLVERELDDDRSAEVRSHAAGCESCGRALARLEGGRRAARELVRAEPPRLDAVLAAARQKAADARATRAAAESAPPTPPRTTNDHADEPSSFVDIALRWLGGWAIRPQVAMAALLVLMIGIGVYNLPHFRSGGRSDGHDDGALVEPDVHAELGPSPLAPAEPLRLDVDPRTQRVALGTEAGDDQDQQDERPTTAHAEADVARTTVRPPATMAARAAAPIVAPDVVAEIAPSDTVGRVEEGPLPEVVSAPEQPAVVLAPPSAGLAAPRAPSASSPPPAEEVAPTTPSAAALLPAAILRQARALASAGHCDEAAPRYRSLLADHPDFADAPRAMLELAECDRRLGRIDEADRWLARAEAFPSVSAEARRARSRIDAEQRAYDRSVDSVDDRAASSAASSSVPMAAPAH